MTKRALVLSGGGAKGAFQAGALKYLILEKNYWFEKVAGVSVGALNGVMVAMKMLPELIDIWMKIENEKVYTGSMNFWTVLKMALFGKKSVYSNQPLWTLIQKYVTRTNLQRIEVEFTVGMTSLVSGKYVIGRHTDSDFAKCVLASTVMPVVWEDVDISSDRRGMVDGGLAHITPIGDVLSPEIEEIIIINCTPRTIDVQPDPKNAIQIAFRSLEIILHTSFVKDIDNFIQINHLVEQCQSCHPPFKLTVPKKNDPAQKRELRSYAYTLLEPDKSLGETLDFSTEKVKWRFDYGYERAKEIVKP